MQQGRGGMGSHKHGISGRGGPSPGTKQWNTRRANRELLKQQEIRRKHSAARRMFNTVKEALEQRGG